MLWLCLSPQGFRTDHGSCTLVYSVLHPRRSYMSSRLQCQWPLPIEKQAHNTSHKAPLPHTKQNTKRQHVTCAAETKWNWNLVSNYKVLNKGRMQQTYHLGYCFKIEARFFNYVSQSEYRTEWSILWIMEAFADVCSINTLHQVTPGNTSARSRAKSRKTEGFAWVCLHNGDSIGDSAKWETNDLTSSPLQPSKDTQYR